MRCCVKASPTANSFCIWCSNGRWCVKTDRFMNRSQEGRSHTPSFRPNYESFDFCVRCDCPLHHHLSNTSVYTWSPGPTCRNLLNPSIFAFRKCQWSPETEKSSNRTLFPYKTSFKIDLSKIWNRTSGNPIALLATICQIHRSFPGQSNGRKLIM